MARIETFFEMGGYAAFVWPAFALTALVMVALAVASLRRLRAQQKDLKSLEASAPHRRQRGGAAGRQAAP